MTGTVLAGYRTFATATPSPLPQQGPDPSSVTPGFLGFVVIFVLAIATWLLLRNLTARLRRMRFREETRLADERAHSTQPDDGAPGSR